MNGTRLPTPVPGLGPDRLFRALHSFSGLPSRALILLGIASVIATGAIEWATVLPFPNDVVFVLIIGGVAFHGSTVAGTSLSVLAALTRVVATGASAAREPVAWPLAALDGSALLVLLLGIVVLARALYRAIGALQDQALRDPLTSTLNSRGFMDIAERERLRALRNGHPLTLTYFDIDGLKKVNDAAGHQAGDQLLLRFVGAVAASIRPYDIFGRLGGDEFVLMLPATNRQTALGVVTRIHDQLRDRLPPVSVSVGAVTYSAPEDPLETMVQRADHLMYQAKRAGGSRLVGEVRSPEPGSETHLIELDDLATRN